MDDLNITISKNITFLRKKAGLTQLQLAEKLNYSDKAISKWERGESLPDIVVLKRIADMFNVTLDTLVTPQNLRRISFGKHISLSKTITTLLAGLLVWLIATIVFVVLSYAGVWRAYLCFIIAIPVSSLVCLVFTAIWKQKNAFFALLSLFVWSTITAIYLGIIKFDMWLIFLIGIPLQIGIILWFILSKHREKTKDID
ncbi:MAG: helix-turn-helix transcriptional regulator [Clostridia bacterium]|nr:helix-turn-helix transcriptional regulator [Clostridia bacterium]